MENRNRFSLYARLAGSDKSLSVICAREERGLVTSHPTDHQQFLDFPGNFVPDFFRTFPDNPRVSETESQIQKVRQSYQGKWVAHARPQKKPKKSPENRLFISKKTCANAGVKCVGTASILTTPVKLVKSRHFSRKKEQDWNSSSKRFWTLGLFSLKMQIFPPFLSSQTICLQIHYFVLKVS